MLFTNIFTLITLATASVLTDPFEARLDQTPKRYRDWKCVRYDWPHCGEHWSPMCCSRGWGDHNCNSYCEFPNLLEPDN
jgi:hypothetical protein